MALGGGTKWRWEKMIIEPEAGRWEVDVAGSVWCIGTVQGESKGSETQERSVIGACEDLEND